MMINPSLKIIRAKKLGVLIRDARIKSGKSVEDCAQAIGLPADELTGMEFGERPPTLPELEILAYYLEIPLAHFWGNEVLQTDGSEKSVDAAEVTQLRQNVIGALIRKTRIEQTLSIEELAQEAGITPELLQSYEQGEEPIPLPELEVLSQAINKSIDDFEDEQSPVGLWFMEQKYIDDFLGLPQDLQEFVGRSVNRPYLELAVRLSELKVEKLRALAESLLEITL